MAETTTESQYEYYNYDDYYEYTSEDGSMSYTSDYDRFRWVLHGIVEPIVFALGLVCNFIILGVVLGTASLRKQCPKTVYVIWMVVLDCCLLALWEAHRMGSTDGRLSCRFWTFFIHLDHLSTWLFTLLGCEYCVSSGLPSLGRTLSSLINVNVLVIVLLFCHGLYSLGPTLNMESGHGYYCVIADWELYMRFAKASMFIYYVLPLLVLAAAVLSNCQVGRRPGPTPVREPGTGTGEVTVEVTPPPYQHLDHEETNPPRGPQDTATTVPTTMLWSVTIFSTILLGPGTFIHLYHIYSHYSSYSSGLRVVSEVSYMMARCFYSFKLLVYLVGWRDFRASCVALGGRLQHCVTSRRRADDRSPLAMEMVDADNRSEQ